ncbi:hypothetical protein [Natronolimnobius baerhuensis]|uniref:Uncharacterized protein n=1 Tax=Natronolimnobius baerhuensis TaxID=253108 RepID=A0A202E982_9EURY|nr:hypothetical protein [Natronolimnobius baerhuensis]OVE84530.1 hypothetical protein B2G88_08990 [Natronolimnobius baerhuensis]
MFTDGDPTEQTTPRQYLVKCDGCSFEQSADGRDEAATIGNGHHRETNHDVIAVEVPPSVTSS